MGGGAGGALEEQGQVWRRQAGARRGGGGHAARRVRAKPRGAAAHQGAIGPHRRPDRPVVYLLYGLTAEEVAVVEGKG